MNNTACRYIIFILLCSIPYLLLFPERPLSDENNNSIAVIISKRIKPYLNALEGITDSITKDSNKINVLFLSNSDKNNKKIYLHLIDGEYDLCVGVGPEAAELLWSGNKKNELLKLYTAILDPDAIKLGPEACGISLRIPVKIQLREIEHSFPGITRIGLIFDPDHNQWFYDKASKTAAIHGIEIIPLSVGSKIQIPKKIKDNWKRIDCIWMIPDRTVISEKIIQYIIKQGIYNNKGVIGYNSFFVRSGAFFSFEFDYNELGIQTGKKIKSYLENGICSEEPPLFNKIINYKIVRKLGIKVEE